MADHAISNDPAVQAQLERLWSLSPGADVLGLGRITALLARVGNPHLRLPPVFHVAGTNGKGSTCAFLRAMMEAGGKRVHVYSSPHLVRFNERIRLAGRLIDDATLAPLLAEVLDAGGDIGASFFEVTTAAAFLVFSRTPADACIIEVGLGGRLDATNVVQPVVTGIAALGIDHEAFLLAQEAGTPSDPNARIAFEKAGIAKAGVPLVTQSYEQPAESSIAAVAAAAGAPLIRRGQDWHVASTGAGSIYRDSNGELTLPPPSLPGTHQIDNASLAIAMLRHQRAIELPPQALVDGITTARWSARMQRLGNGPLTGLLGYAPDGGVWLDGAHNDSAAQAITANWRSNRETAIIIGMLANKDAAGVIGHLAKVAEKIRFVAIPVPGHAHHAPEALVEMARQCGVRSAECAPDVPAAFRLLAPHRPQQVLIAGSLYLAGEVLAANDEMPD